MVMNSLFSYIYLAFVMDNHLVSVTQLTAVFNRVLRGSPYAAAFLVIFGVLYILIRHCRQLISGQGDGCHCSGIKQKHAGNRSHPSKAVCEEKDLVKCQGCSRSIQRSESRQVKHPAERV